MRRRICCSGQRSTLRKQKSLLLKTWLSCADSHIIRPLLFGAMVKITKDEELESMKNNKETTCRGTSPGGFNRDVVMKCGGTSGCKKCRGVRATEGETLEYR